MYLTAECLFSYWKLLMMRATNVEATLQAQKFEHEQQKKLAEFQSMVEWVKIEKQTAIELEQLEATRQAVVPTTPDKKYIPHLPPLHLENSLPVFLGRFSDSMTAAQIPPQQWVARFRDILTGKVLKMYQSLTEDDKASYITVRDKLLASQNLMAEHCR